MAGGAGIAACSSGADCSSAASGPGAGYCLVDRVVLRVRGGAALATNSAALIARDDNTAAILLHDDRGFYALSGICTHACCAVVACGGAACGTAVSFASACGAPPSTGVATSGPAFLCPCHGSEFDMRGAVLGGPAVQALPAFGVSFDGPDALIDCSRVVASDLRV